MTTTTLTVNEQHAVFSDLDLLLVVRMALGSVTESDRTRLARVEKVWTEALETRGPGVIDLHIEEFANNADIRPHLVALLTRLESSLLTWGDEVPLSHLKNRYPISGIRFEHPYPTHHLLSATRQLRELIEQGK